MTAKALARGFYTVPEAARLIEVGNTRRIYGWLRGYHARQAGPLLQRDYEPIAGVEELSFLDLMEVRFVEHFREYQVKSRSLRIAAERLRREFETQHPFASNQVHLVADKADVFLVVMREIAAEAGDPALLSLTTDNYVMHEIIRRSLVPGVSFDPKTGLASVWVPRPHQFPEILIDPRIAYGHPAGASRIPTVTLSDAWKAEGEDEDAVAYWFQVSTHEVRRAVEFERALERKREAVAA
jgi:uncharacterized protein (DUF433 family)